MWTEQQKKAIQTNNKNILVSAAAGSGKTAVLTERILQKLVTGETQADRLVVVTFTKAAAAEMRERIRELMRYSGPRMLFVHPFMALSHLYETVKQKILSGRDKSHRD